MPGPERIDGKDIEAWADSSPDAEHVLPRLVRRLLRVSTRLSLLDMPDGTAKNNASWDGICEALEASAHCPRGVSGWELSKAKGVRSKLDSDYDARTKDPAQLDPTATYVAVTARRYADKKGKRGWIGKKAWAENRKKEGKWADVRVLDADNLAQWLDEYPGIAAWFASEHLRRPTYEIRSLDRFLSDWTRETTEVLLSPSLLLLDRGRQCRQVLEWLRQRSPSTLAVQAASKREARLFVAAALDSLEASLREELASRTLIVESADAWRWAIAQSHHPPLVLIPDFLDFEPSLGHGAHFAVIPHDRETEVTENAISIADSLPWSHLADELVKLGLPEERARQIAAQSRGNLDALQRLLGAADTRPPAWLTREDHAELVVMLLLGQWNPSHTGDRSAVARLDMDPESLDRLCTRLMMIEGAPIEHALGGYRWASVPSAWPVLIGLLSESALQRFEACAIEALTVDHPMFDRPSGDRIRGAFVTTPYSQMLREGIANSVLHLSRQDESLRRRLRFSLGTRVAKTIASRVLQPRWVRWASLGQLLIVLAEAAPREFLTRLELSLADLDGAGRIFEEEVPITFDGAAPRDSLLWALELVAWAPETMSDAVELLMQLAERQSDRPRLSTRPSRSLTAVFHIADPQTLVEEDERFQVLECVTNRHPEVGFELLIELVRQLEGRVLPQSARPQFDERVSVMARMPSRTQIHARGTRCFNLALELAGEVATRWVTMIREPFHRFFGETVVQQIVDRIIPMRMRFDDEGCVVISATARDELSSVYGLPQWEKHEARTKALHRILEAFQPTDPVLRVAWLFQPRYTLPEPHSKLDYEGTRRKVNQYRDEALAQILAHNAGVDLLVQLVERSAANEIGEALARSARSEEFDSLLLRNEPSGPLLPLVAPFAVQRHYMLSADKAWLDELLRLWLEHDRERDALDTLWRKWPEPIIWDLLDEIGDPLRTHYWMDLARPLGELEDNQLVRAVTNFLAADNRGMALRSAGYRCKGLPTGLLLRVLESVRMLDAGTPSTGPGDDYYVSKIFEEFDRRLDLRELTSDQLKQIAALEFHFILLFDDFGGRHHYRRPRFVWGMLEGNPQLFVDLIIHENANEVLGGWRTVPGQALEDIRDRESALYKWASNALDLAQQKYGDNIGELWVAAVLARPEAAEDGHWPCEAARRLLQSGTYPRLSSALKAAVLDQSRGVARFLDGGDRERGAALRYEKSAVALRATNPATSRLLADLADSFRGSAELEGQIFGEIRSRGGLSRQAEPEGDSLDGDETHEK